MPKPKNPVLVFLTLILVILTSQATWAAVSGYRITRINQGAYSDDTYPTINNPGQIAFYHYGNSLQTGDPPQTLTSVGQYQLFNLGRLSTLNVPSNYPNSYPGNYFHPPQLLLNDQGQFGYRIQDYNDNGKYKVYFHDGPQASPQLLFSHSNCGNVQLNQLGQMAWTSWDEAANIRVHLFANGVVTQPASYPSANFVDDLCLNDKGQLLWLDLTDGADPSFRVVNLRLYDNGVTTCLHSTSWRNWMSAKLNNRGQAVWIEKDPDSGLANIMLYEGGVVKKIPGGEGFQPDYLPYLQLNDKGQVMWLGIKDLLVETHNIYLYSEGKTSQITHYAASQGINFDLWQNWLTDQKTKFAPRLNNNGEIVWTTFMQQGSSDYYDYAVQVYRRGRITRLDSWTVYRPVSGDFTIWSGSSVGSTYAQINDAGQVVWDRYTGPFLPDIWSKLQIYLATPVTPISHLELLLQN